MRHVILISHGEFAPGLENAMSMLIGKRENVHCTSMLDGMGADVYIKNFQDLIRDTVQQQDQILLLGDLAEGSPMTNALNVLAEYGLLDNTIAFAGMNLPMVVTAAMLEGEMNAGEIEQAVLEESHHQLRTMKFGGDADDAI